jgi:hypothetical protein
MTSNRNRPRRCDACGKRMRENHHELHLSAPLTGQVLGRYHAGMAFGGCMVTASKYFSVGNAVKATFAHPDRCGDDQEHCDAGFADLAGTLT